MKMVRITIDKDNTTIVEGYGKHWGRRRRPASRTR